MLERGEEEHGFTTCTKSSARPPSSFSSERQLTMFGTYSGETSHAVSTFQTASGGASIFTATLISTLSGRSLLERPR